MGDWYGRVGITLTACSNVFFVGLMLPLSALAQPDPALDAPTSITIRRRTYFDFGPPFKFYEVFRVTAGDRGVSIERTRLTPKVSCAIPAKVEVLTAEIHESIQSVLRGVKLCAVPLKKVRHKRKRCKHCLVFSGADITIQAQCGEEVRQIPITVLDRDMFSRSENTPESTSWAMSVLALLDQALGASVIEQPAFAVASAATAATAFPQSEGLVDLASGRLDSMFEGAPDKPSELYAESLQPPVPPAVRIVQSGTPSPISPNLPAYPPLARLAHTEGAVVFTPNIEQDGRVSNVTFSVGNPLLREAVRDAVEDWRFPPDDADSSGEWTIEFQANCE